MRVDGVGGIGRRGTTVRSVPGGSAAAAPPVIDVSTLRNLNNVPLSWTPSLPSPFPHYSFSLSLFSVSFLRFLRASLLSPFHRSPDRHSPDPSVKTNVIPSKKDASILIYHSWLNTRPEKNTRVYIRGLGSRFQGGAATSCPDGNLSNHGGLNKRQGG